MPVHQRTLKHRVVGKTSRVTLAAANALIKRPTKAASAAAAAAAVAVAQAEADAEAEALAGALAKAKAEGDAAAVALAQAKAEAEAALVAKAKAEADAEAAQKQSDRFKTLMHEEAASNQEWMKKHTKLRRRLDKVYATARG